MPPSLWLTYTILAVAIVSEVTATTALKAADGFTLVHSIVVDDNVYLVLASDPPVADG